MEKVTSKELQRKFGQVRTKAHQGGVMITHHGNDDMALVSAAEYQRLKALDPDKVTDRDLEALVAKHQDTLELLADR